MHLRNYTSNGSDHLESNVGRRYYFAVAQLWDRMLSMKTLLALGLLLLASLSTFAGTPNRPLTDQESIAVAHMLTTPLTAGHVPLAKPLRPPVILRADGYPAPDCPWCFHPFCNLSNNDYACLMEWIAYEGCRTSCGPATHTEDRAVSATLRRQYFISNREETA